MTDEKVESSAAKPAVATDIAYVAVFAALIAVSAITPGIPVGIFGVPITLQTLAVSITALVLGPKLGGAAVALYLLVGTAGLPIFTNGAAGLAPWAGVTAGYLLSFFVYAVVAGLISRAIVRQGITKLTPVWLLLTLVACRLLITFPLGVLGIARATGKSVFELWAVDIVYWPGDLLKSIVAVAVAMAVFKAFPRLLAR